MWLSSLSRGRSSGLRRRRPATARLQLEVLEDRLTPSGFAVSAGGIGDDEGAAVATDPGGGLYVTGKFSNTMQFHDGTQLTSAGDDDVFVARYSASGAVLWARRFGGDGVDRGQAITLDSFGNILVTGMFQGSADFHRITLTGGGAFVLKLDPSDGHTLWAKALVMDYQTFGGSGFGIAVDQQNNVYTTGSFARSVDMDPGPGTVNFTNFSIGNLGTLYVSKLNANGAFAAAYYAKSDVQSVGASIAVDGKNQVYVTGTIRQNLDFDPDAVHAGNTDLLSTPSEGTGEGFVLKLSSAVHFVWVRPIGVTNPNPSEDAGGTGIAVGPGGKVYATGLFAGTAHFGALALASAGDWDIYVSQLNSAGQFLWARRLGAAGLDIGRDIAVDALGNAFTTGEFNNIVDFDPGAGAFPLASNGGDDVFISELDKDGKFVCATHMGGAQWEQGFGIAVDPSGFVDTTGPFESNPSPFGVNAGGKDVFVSKRTLPCKFATNPFGVQGSTLLVTGDARDNHFDFQYTGEGVHARAEEDGETLTFTGIDRIVVRTGAGNDQVTAFFQSIVGDLDFSASLGDGSDTFSAMFAGSALSGAESGAGELLPAVRIAVNGGAGADHLSVAVGNADESPSDWTRALDVTLDGGRDNDTLAVTYSHVTVNAKQMVNLRGGDGTDNMIVAILHSAIDAPMTVKAFGDHGNDAIQVNGGGLDPRSADQVILNGDLHLVLDGGNGNDRVSADLVFDSSSPGSLDAQVLGGLGDDWLALNVYGVNNPDCALINGGVGFDTARATGHNLRVINCEEVLVM